MTTPVHVQIWSDVQCVWCYVGDERWRRAVQQFEGSVELEHHSFELYPDFPVDLDAEGYLRSTRGLHATEQDRLFAAMQATAAREGLSYRPRQIKPTNSHLAMELLHHARDVGGVDQLRQRLYAAYFAEGRHVGTVDSLVVLAGEVGMDQGQARSVLERGVYREVVDDDSARARELGARGVPFAVVDGRYLTPGALESDDLVRVLQRAAAA